MPAWALTTTRIAIAVDVHNLYRPAATLVALKVEGDSRVVIEQGDKAEVLLFDLPP